MNASQHLSPQGRFWRWFSKNSKRLRSFEPEQRRLLAELRRELNRVQEGLVFEFGPPEGETRTFAVSADGIGELFPAVRELVAAAPALPGWEIVAFRPPGNMNVVIEFRGHRLGPDDIWFKDVPEEGRVGLVIYVRGLTEETHEALAGATFILLDNALGEYAVETQLAFLDLQPLPESPRSAGLRPFLQIREAVDVVVH